MTLIPPGAKLAPVDLPPPPPAADPREPEGPRRVSRAHGRAKSPYSSRANSPTRVRADSGSPPPLLSPKPRNASGQAPIGKHGPVHLSRPSSPSSIHSSGSAIFERDIEMPSAQSLSTLGHKGSRVFHHPHGSTLEHTVPAVLDDAVEALTASGPDSIGELEIEAPASAIGTARSGSATLSPALRSRVASMPLNASRSPSPESSPHSPHAPPLSLVAAALAPHIQTKSPTTMSPTTIDISQSMPDSPTQMYHGKHRPAPLRHVFTEPQLPGGWAFMDEDATGATAIRSESNSGALTPMPTALPSHLTPTKEKRRVSFISYNDLLLSVPTAVTSLDDITTGNHAPDHLPGTVSPSVPSRSPVIAASPLAGPVMPDALRPLGGSVLEGEWQREGLGKGLEQRLEDLAFHDKVATTEQKV